MKTSGIPWLKTFLSPSALKASSITKLSKFSTIQVANSSAPLKTYEGTKRANRWDFWSRSRSLYDLTISIGWSWSDWDRYSKTDDFSIPTQRISVFTCFNSWIILNLRTLAPTVEPNSTIIVPRSIQRSDKRMEINSFFFGYLLHWINQDTKSYGYRWNLAGKKNQVIYLIFFVEHNVKPSSI